MSVESTDVAVEPSSAYELASFETVHVATPAMPVQWSLEKFNVAHDLATTGKTKTKIAKDRKIPLAVINKWLESGEFRDYVDSIVQEAAKVSKNSRLKLLMKTLAAREEQAELEGYAEFSRKDSLDIIAEIRKETGEDKGSQQSNYTTLLESLLKHSMENQPKIIQVESQ